MKTLKICNHIKELEEMTDAELLLLEIDKDALTRILKFILQ